MPTVLLVLQPHSSARTPTLHTTSLTNVPGVETYSVSLHTVQFVQILIGAKIFYAESLEKLLMNMSEAKPTIMTAVPRFYQNLFNKVDVVLLSLPSLEAYKNVLENLKKLGKHTSDKIILDMNTISIEDKINFKNEIKKFNIDMLDTPVSGTGAQAWEGDITVFASGDETITKKYNNIFESFSKEVIYVGPFGNGMKFKILANLLVTIHNTAAAEALRLGECAGLDKDMIYKVLGNSAATSVMLQKRMPLMINQNYEPPTASFNLSLIHI